MLTDEEFLSFVNDESLDGLSEEKLNRIIDEEMQKPESEMNTELIEYCLDKINSLNTDTEDNREITEIKDDGSHTVRHKKLKMKRIIAVAAAIAVLLIGVYSVSAVVSEVNLFDGIVELYNDYIRIRFDKTENKTDGYGLLDTDLAKELADHGFGEVLLPEAFLSDEIKITGIEYQPGEYISLATISFKYKHKKGNFFITRYGLKELMSREDFLNVTSDIKEVEVAGITAYCFMQDKDASINYSNGLNVYTIQIPMNLNDAIKFAETIK